MDHLLLGILASRITLTATMAQMYGKEKDSEKDTTGSILLVEQLML